MRYPVDLARDGDTHIAFVPDLPGAHTFGDDEAEALARAVDAAETAIMAMMAGREDIPAPSPAAGRPTIALPALSTVKVELYRTMRAAGVGKAELARRLGWHLPQVDRALDLRHASRLDQLEAAFAALGKRIEVGVRAA